MDRHLVETPGEKKIGSITINKHANAEIQKDSSSAEENHDDDNSRLGHNSTSFDTGHYEGERDQAEEDANHLDGPYQRQLCTDTAHSATPLHSNSVEQPNRLVAAGSKNERKWPSKNVTEETIDDAYVNFIFCCNPSIPLSRDSKELRKIFRMPPKSDGNSFSIYKLLQLVRKFEDGEIKTWTKLAVELGVKRKDDQSTQKVQQYAVRLKVGFKMSFPFSEK